MTPEELSESRWELLYRAEYSTRYHRRRSAFFRKLDTFLTLVVITAGASAFADLVVGSPGRIAQVGTAAVTLISIAQVVLWLGQSAIMLSRSEDSRVGNECVCMCRSCWFPILYT